MFNSFSSWYFTEDTKHHIKWASYEEKHNVWLRRKDRLTFIFLRYARSEFSNWIFCYHENIKAAFLAENIYFLTSSSLGAEASSRLKFLQGSIILHPCVQSFSKWVAIDENKFICYTIYIQISFNLRTRILGKSSIEHGLMYKT